MTTKIIPSPEYIPLSPEDSEIANTYLKTMDMSETAKILQLDLHQVAEYINKPVVQRYISDVFMNSGYRNRLKLGQLLDDIITKKLAELEEAGITSSKDIMDILQFVAKMRKDELEMELRKEEIRSGKPKRQTNIQINNPGMNPYKEFTEKLMDLDQLD